MLQIMKPASEASTNIYLFVIACDPLEWMSEKVSQEKSKTRVALFTVSYCDAIIRTLAKKVGVILKPTGRILATGYCLGCISCIVKKEGKPCVKPEQRTNSMESTGILVEKTMLAEGLGKLDWVNFKTGYLPKIFKKVMLYMTNEPLNEEKFWQDFSKLVHTIE